MDLSERYRGALLGLAAGDALGAALEFERAGTFSPIDDMIGGGPWCLKPGQWTDDTSMALCLAKSLVEKQKFYPIDIMEKFIKWYDTGYFSSTGKSFDTGLTTRTAFDRFRKTRNPYCGSPEDRPGNGSIMRLAPVPMAYARDKEKAIEMSGKSSLLTHGHPSPVGAAKYLGALIAGAINEISKEELLSENYWNAKEQSLSKRIAEIALGSFKEKEPPLIANAFKAGGTLEAALWGFYKTNNFKDGALLVVNLGDDADTAGAVYGQLAGAYYGEKAIPAGWRQKLTMRRTIETLADQLFQLSRKL